MSLNPPSFRFPQVNGQDLSHASHEDAVAAFRSATEPIVVEVLRRAAVTTKTTTIPTSASASSSPSPAAITSPSKMKNLSVKSPSMVTVSTQTDEAADDEEYVVDEASYYNYIHSPSHHSPPGLYAFNGNE